MELKRGATLKTTVLFLSSLIIHLTSFFLKFGDPSIMCIIKCMCKCPCFPVITRDVFVMQKYPNVDIKCTDSCP